MVTAELKNYRQAPRKVRLVVDSVRGKNVETALTTLTFMSKKASLVVKKLIESAVANASHNFNLKSDNLFVKEITVDQGPIIKRWRARARGRAASIHKHTSHIKVVLAEKETASKAANKDNK
jgi:large subunit ribosomal protein L22